MRLCENEASTFSGYEVMSYAKTRLLRSVVMVQFEKKESKTNSPDIVLKLNIKD